MAAYHVEIMEGIKEADSSDQFSSFHDDDHLSNSNLGAASPPRRDASSSSGSFAKSPNKRLVTDLPDVKNTNERVGRRIVINPHQQLPSPETFNNDPITRNSHNLITGQMRVILHPFILAHRRVTTVLHDLVFGSTRGKFVSNSVRTARYTVIDFLPKQLVVQFSKFANLYFLFITLLQLVPGWSPTGQYTTIFPLSIFVAFAIVKEGIEDYYRHKQDAAENGTIAKRLKFFTKSLAAGHEEIVVALDDVMWKDIKVGDVVLIEQGEALPADIILLATSYPNGICYIETSNLDGESHLKQKQALTATQSELGYISDFANFHCYIQAASTRATSSGDEA